LTEIKDGKVVAESRGNNFLQQLLGIFHSAAMQKCGEIGELGTLLRWPLLQNSILVK
jgi:hypothetical protein